MVVQDSKVEGSGVVIGVVIGVGVGVGRGVSG